MAFTDWLWLIPLIIAILKVIAQLPPEDLRAIANIRKIITPDPAPRKRQPKKPSSPTGNTVT